MAHVLDPINPETIDLLRIWAAESGFDFSKLEKYRKNPKKTMIILDHDGVAQHLQGKDFGFTFADYPIAVSHLRSLGYDVALVTGRGYEQVKKGYQDSGIEKFIGSYGHEVKIKERDVVYAHFQEETDKKLHEFFNTVKNQMHETLENKLSNIGIKNDIHARILDSFDDQEIKNSMRVVHWQFLKDEYDLSDEKIQEISDIIYEYISKVNNNDDYLNRPVENKQKIKVYKNQLSCEISRQNTLSKSYHINRLVDKNIENVIVVGDTLADKELSFNLPSVKHIEFYQVAQGENSEFAPHGNYLPSCPELDPDNVFGGVAMVPELFKYLSNGFSFKPRIKRWFNKLRKYNNPEELSKALDEEDRYVIGKVCIQPKTKKLHNGNPEVTVSGIFYTKSGKHYEQVFSASCEKSNDGNYEMPNSRILLDATSKVKNILKQFEANGRKSILVYEPNVFNVTK